MLFTDFLNFYIAPKLLYRLYSEIVSYRRHDILYLIGRCSKIIRTALAILEWLWDIFYLAYIFQCMTVVSCCCRKSLLFVFQAYLGRLSCSRGSSPGWTHRLGRSSRCRRSGQTSILYWHKTRPGQCSTDLLPDSLTDTDWPGVTQTRRDKAKRQNRCCSPRGSSWRQRRAPSTGSLSLARYRRSVLFICCQVRQDQEWNGSVNSIEVIHVSTVSLKGTIHPCRQRYLTDQ